MESPTENNQLIANFMFGDNAIHPNQYHENWNELMPVIEKIESLEEVIEKVEITNYRCLITAYVNSDNKFSADYWYIERNPMFASKIHATYEASLDFINWYNKNK